MSLIIPPSNNKYLMSMYNVPDKQYRILTAAQRGHSYSCSQFEETKAYNNKVN